MTNMIPTMITEELTKPEKASEESSTPVTNKMQTAPRKITSDLSRVNSSAAIIAMAVTRVIQASNSNPNSIVDFLHPSGCLGGYFLEIGECQNRSECVPVRRNSSVNSVSLCSHVISQSGSIWHSQMPSILPDNLCGRYFAGSEPVASSKSIASVIHFFIKVL